MKNSAGNTLALTTPHGEVTPIDRWLAQKILKTIGTPPVSLRLWNGEEIRSPGTEDRFCMCFHDRRALVRLLANPFMNFGEDYSSGRIEIEGNLRDFFITLFQSYEKAHPLVLGKRVPFHRRIAWNSNTIAKARSNVHLHYDLGNDFFQLWLDPEMAYTCAYFPTADATLEEAQTAKMEHVCRKVRLRPGMTVVEAGCGWGALARYMAKSYGVKVKAYNISKEQIVHARKRAKEENLEDRVEFVEDDYRNISGTYNAFVSVGMLEHVGPRQYGDFGRVIERSLSEDGVGLVHSISQNTDEKRVTWFEKRIFPGSYAPTLREMTEIFERWGLTVWDVENLRPHYAKTLEHWLERFDEHEAQVKAMVDESFVRAWRLYLSATNANFSRGAVQLYQILFTRASNNMVPLTRSYLYAPTGKSYGTL